MSPLYGERLALHDASGCPRYRDAETTAFTFILRMQAGPVRTMSRNIALVATSSAPVPVRLVRRNHLWILAACDRPPATFWSRRRRIDKVPITFRTRCRRVYRTHHLPFPLQDIGRKGRHHSKVRESLVSIGASCCIPPNEADAINGVRRFRKQLSPCSATWPRSPTHVTFGNTVRSLDAISSFMRWSEQLSRCSRSPPWFVPPTLIASIRHELKHMPESMGARDRWHRLSDRPGSSVCFSSGRRVVRQCQPASPY